MLLNDCTKTEQDCTATRAPKNEESEEANAPRHPLSDHQTYKEHASPVRLLCATDALKVAQR